MRRKPKNCNKIETDKKCLKNITTFLLLLFFSGHFTNWLIGHNYPFSFPLKSVCEKTVTYIGMIQWEVKQMKALDDLTPFLAVMKWSTGLRCDRCCTRIEFA